jgi:hypothetical protein
MVYVKKLRKLSRFICLCHVKRTKKRIIYEKQIINNLCVREVYLFVKDTNKNCVSYQAVWYTTLLDTTHAIHSSRTKSLRITTD